MTEYLTGCITHLFQIDIRSHHAIEQYHARYSMCIQLIDQRNRIRQILTQLYDYRNRNALLDLLDNIDVQAFVSSIFIIQITANRHDVQFQRIGTCRFNLLGKICPFSQTVTIDAGNDRYRTLRLGFFDKFQVFIQSVCTMIIQ